MGKDSGIEWTHHTFNPWWGCTKVSAGCANCYAETLANRWGFGWGKTTARRFFPDKENGKNNHWAEPDKWNTEAAKMGIRKRVFCASMADVFEDGPGLEEWRVRLWMLIGSTKHLDWLILTKRPENINAMLPVRWAQEGLPSNMWMGTSCEDQAAANKRIPELLKVKAKVRFLSCEPLLGPVNFHLHGNGETHSACGPDCWANEIHWVIVGGESGHGARRMELEWARKLRNQCYGGQNAFFMKQLGGTMDKRGALEDMPEELRIRTFPK